MTLIAPPSRFDFSSRWLAGNANRSHGCRLGRRITRSRVVTPASRHRRATLPAPRRRSPATARSHRSNRRTSGTTDEPVTTGPVHAFLGGSGTSPEVCFPFSVRQPRRVLTVRTGGRPGGPHPASALFAPARPRTLPGMIPARTSVTAAQVAPAVFRSSANRQWHGSNGGRSGWVVRSPPTCRFAAVVCAVTRHAFVDREDATPVVFDPSCGWGRCNRRFARVTTDPASRALRHGAIRRPSRVMHRRVL